MFGKTSSNDYIVSGYFKAVYVISSMWRNHWRWSMTMKIYEVSMSSEYNVMCFIWRYTKVEIQEVESGWWFDVAG